MKSVTIGLAVYNAEEYLDKALKDLSNQSFQDMKILVSDNCSTDKTPEILKKWANKDSRFEIHTQKENIGVILNFQYVLENADSPWFMFAAHDDWRSPNFVEELYNNAVNNPETKLSVAKTCLVQDNAKPTDNKMHYIPFNEKINSATGLTRVRLLMKYALGGWYYALFDRKALINAQKAAKNFGHVWAHDLILLLPFLLSGKVVGSNKAIFYQYITSSSAEKYKPKTAKEQYILYRDFWKSMLKILNDTKASKSRKLCLAKDLYRFSKHSGRIHRIAKTYIKSLIS